MLLQENHTTPTFRSSSVVIDWSKDKMPAYATASADRHQQSDSLSLVQWVQSFPTPEEVHVYLGNVSFNGQRTLMRQLQALGCTVTCKQFCA